MYDVTPWIFIVFMDRIMREVKERLQGRLQLTTTNVQLLLFADDMIMVTKKKEDMQRNLAVMKTVGERWGIKIHWGKTKVMMVSRMCSVV